jgi:hypothetical protein
LIRTTLTTVELQSGWWLNPIRQKQSYAWSAPQAKESNGCGGGRSWLHNLQAKCGEFEHDWEASHRRPGLRQA